jgi:YihY family inner membrane protein
VTGPAALAARVERVLRAGDSFQQRHTPIGFPVGVIKKFGDDEAGKHAALLAYYGFFSVFPLMLVFVTLLGYALAGNPALQERIIGTVVAQMPVFGPQIRASVQSFQGSGVGLAVGLAGTLFGGLGVTQSAQDAMNAVWNVPRRIRPNYWFRLARGLIYLLLLAVAVVAGTVLSGLGASGPGILGRLPPLAAAVVLNLLVFVVTFQVLTARRVPWRQLLPGAACGAVAWSALQALGVYIINRQLERANVIYGTFAVVIGLLSWFHLSAQVVLYAAELNVVLARRLWPRSLLQPPLTEPDTRVLTALAKTEERLADQTVDVSFGPEADAPGDPPDGPPGGPPGDPPPE